MELIEFLFFLQIEHAIKREKSAFDHINTDWNIHDDGSTDFSDDDTVLTDERKSRSRPPSFVGGDSPVALRSRSSTCDSIQSGSSPSSSCNPYLAQSGQQIPGNSNSKIPIPSSGTSPKQYAGGSFASHYGSGGGGGSSPNSSSSSSIVRQASAQIAAAAAAQSKKSSSGKVISN